MFSLLSKYKIQISYLIATLISLGGIAAFFAYKYHESFYFTSRFDMQLPDGVIPIKLDYHCGIWSSYSFYTFSVTDDQIAELEKNLSSYKYTPFVVSDIRLSDCYYRFNTEENKVLLSKNEQNPSITKYLVWSPKYHLLEAITFTH